MPALAKLTRPKVHRAVARDRLFSLLDERREHPLIWVTAPAGSGKTTLVASYLEARKLRCVWYQVDAGDDDIGTFFYYLALALPAARKGKAAMPVLTPEHRADLPAFCRHFFREFFGRLPDGAVAIFDNYQELPAGSVMHHVLERAVAEVPEGCNLVAISRAPPPPELASLQVNGRLRTIDWTSLRMSFEETRAIVASRVAVDDATMQRIHRVSLGWAAGVALTLQRLQADGQTDQQCAREELFDYFANQVLNAAPRETQEFLMCTALLSTIDGEMADALLGRKDSDDLLEELYRKGAFIDRRSVRPASYQYHDLFRAFLLVQLERSRTPEELRRLKIAAATQMERAGHADHAVRLYLQANDMHSATRLILTIAPTLLMQGRGGALREWIRALPNEQASENPWLHYWAGACIARSEPVEARSHFEAGLTQFAERGDITSQRLLCAEIIVTYMHEFANLIPLDGWLGRLEPLLSDPTPYPSAAAELQVRTAEMFALGFRRPDAKKLQHCAARMMALLDEQIPPELAAVSIGTVIMNLYITGDLTSCARAAARFKALHEASALSPVSSALGSMQVGHAAFRGGDREAIHLFDRALAIGAEHAIPLKTLYVYSHLGLAFCAIERGDLAQADWHRRKLEEHRLPGRKIDRVATTRVQLWIACHRGQLEVALGVARDQVLASQECGLFQLIFESHVLLAIVCTELHRPAELADALKAVRAQVAGTALAHFAYLADFTEAYDALLRDDRERCHASLRAGLSSSRADEGMFLLRLTPNVLPKLCAEALASGIEVAYFTQLIGTLAIKPPPGTIAWPWPLRIHTFGRFEILRDNQPLEFSRKAPKKTLALLKALIAFGGKNVREQALLDTFWSDEEGDVAARSLTAALHRLRNLLGDNDAIIQQGGVLSLDRALVWTDVWAFEEQSKQSSTELAQTLLTLYRGAFLKEDESEPWTVTTRERLRGKFIHALVAVTGALEKEGQYHLAIDCYLRGIDADPVIEQFYQGLMRCYARLDRNSEAIAAYRRLKQILSISLSLKPSQSTERLYADLRLDAVQNRVVNK
jgi:LuxR family maltose regulon positive regulatory protein